MILSHLHIRKLTQQGAVDPHPRNPDTLSKPLRRCRQLQRIRRTTRRQHLLPFRFRLRHRGSVQTLPPITIGAILPTFSAFFHRIVAEIQFGNRLLQHIAKTLQSYLALNHGKTEAGRILP